MKDKEKNTNNIPRIKSWDELTLADNFIFQKLMLNEELCKKILSEILGKEVIKIEYTDYERTIDISPDAKGIRLDIYIKGESEVYNIEMQNTNYDCLPKRGRYYSPLIDLDLLEKGAEYDELCHSYSIFINTFDFYKKNQYKYTFTYKCDEIPGLEYGDLTTMIMLNTLGTEGNISNDLKTFLNCINGVFSDDDFSATIKNEYEHIKLNRKFRREYMILEMELKKQFNDGEKVGYDKGHTDGLSDGINILHALQAGESVKDIADRLKIPIQKAQDFYDSINKTQ